MTRTTAGAWRVKDINAATFKQVSAWNLEAPDTSRADAGETLKVRGWLISNLYSHIRLVSDDGRDFLLPINAKRKDVVSKKFPDDTAIQEKLLGCGFELIIGDPSESFEVYFGNNDTFHKAFDLSFEGFSGATALYGRDQYLFLDNDTNLSVDQFTGKFTIDNRTLEGWRAHFRDIEARARLNSFQYVFCIAPSKEEAHSELYPFMRGTRTSIDIFLEFFSDQPLVYPSVELRKHRSIAFNRTDTHWTDYGAVLAANAVVRRLGLDGVEFGRHDFSIRELIGDLGNKCSPPLADPTLVFSERKHPDNSLIFDNGVSNHGCIRVFSNPHASVAETCVVAGDSFGTNFSAALSFLFKRVVYLYKPAAFDQFIQDNERARYWIFQINQRFIIGQPNSREAITDRIKSKVSNMSEQERLNLSHKLWHYRTDRYLKAYAEATISALKAL